MRRSLLLILFLALVCSVTIRAKADEAGFRTDTSNAPLPWYRLTRDAFPPIGSEHRVRGELLEADYIHRTGRFRDEATGRLANFSLLPYACVYHLNTEADLRDVPLGTRLVFFMYQDESGEFTKAAVVREDSTEVPGEGATEEQRRKHVAFVKQRGLAARIDGVESKKIVVTFLGDPISFAAMLKDEGIDPEQWAREHRQVHAAVANEELRTYNPPVDQESAIIQDFHRVPTDRYGCSGVQWTLDTNLLLEGFRKGRIVRIFMPGWPTEDMPYGEGLYTERPGAKTEEESDNQYSYRTDFGNRQLPWYQLKADQFPPFQSQHAVTGELLKVDAVHRAGEFRVDGTGEVVAFTMPPYGFIQFLNAEGELTDLPLGRRYTFFLYQDDKGAFTKAVTIMDEYTRLASETITLRVESVRPSEGRIFLADQLAIIKDDKEHLVRPPDLGHLALNFDDTAVIRKGDQSLKFTGLAAGDELLVNTTGCSATTISRCTDAWVGLDTHKQVTENQRKKHDAFMRQNGLPGRIEKVDAKHLTICFFAGNRRYFQDLMNGEPPVICVKVVDEDLHAAADDRVTNFRFKDHLPSDDTAGTYGSAGVRWIVEADSVPPELQPGRIIRVLRPEWLPADAAKH